MKLKSQNESNSCIANRFMDRSPSGSYCLPKLESEILLDFVFQLFFSLAVKMSSKKIDPEKFTKRLIKSSS